MNAGGDRQRYEREPSPRRRCTGQQQTVEGQLYLTHPIRPTCGLQTGGDHQRRERERQAAAGKPPAPISDETYVVLEKYLDRMQEYKCVLPCLVGCVCVCVCVWCVGWWWWGGGGGWEG